MPEEATVEDKLEETKEIVNSKQEEKQGQGKKPQISQGGETIIRLGQDESMNVDTIPTGSLSLDIALGVGGFPRGRVIEVFGNESSGKTTVALHMMAETQKKDGIVAFVDAEHALDPEYAGQIGVNTDDLLFTQPNYGEEALEIVEELIRSGNVDLVVVDSVSALVPIAELEDDMDEAQIGLQARLMSKAMRKLTGAISQHKTTVIFLNQIRSKVNNRSFGGKQTTTSGGRALRFYSSVRINLYIKKTLTNSDGEKQGIHTVGKVVKNKVAPPFKQGEMDIMYGRGIVREREILGLGVKHGIVEQAGSWYKYDGDSFAQGMDNAEEYLIENPEMADEIESKIRDEVDLEKR